MAASHTGEDTHVRTLQAVFRRAGLSQSLLRCGVRGRCRSTADRGSPRARRRGARPDAAHVLRLSPREHPAEPPRRLVAGGLLGTPSIRSQVAVRDTVARIFGVAVRTTSIPARRLRPADLRRSRWSTIARAFLLLADPAGVATDDAARPLRAGPDPRPRRDDGRAGHGRRHDEVLDTELMRPARAQLVCKGGAEGLRGVGLLPGARARGPVRRRAGDQDRGRRRLRARQPCGDRRGARAARRPRRARPARARPSSIGPSVAGPDGSRSSRRACRASSLAPLSELG